MHYTEHEINKIIGGYWRFAGEPLVGTWTEIQGYSREEIDALHESKRAELLSALTAAGYSGSQLEEQLRMRGYYEPAPTPARLPE